MKGHVGLFIFGLGAASAAAFLYDKLKSGEIDTAKIGSRVREMSQDVAREAGQVKDHVVELSTAAMADMVDINQASHEELRALGLHDPEMMDRLIEGRPYRNKMDLITRMIVPQDLFNAIKDRIDIRHPNESVKVA